MKKINILVCPRCFKKHLNLEVKTFSSPVIDQNPADRANPCVYHEWAMCPVKNEPLLFQNPSKNDVFVPVEPKRERVERLAHRLWEMDGRRKDRDKLHWKLAVYALTAYLRIPSSTEMEEEMRDFRSEFVDEVLEKDMQEILDKCMRNDTEGT